MTNVFSIMASENYNFDVGLLYSLLGFIFCFRFTLFIVNGYVVVIKLVQFAKGFE